MKRLFLYKLQYIEEFNILEITTLLTINNISKTKNFNSKFIN